MILNYIYQIYPDAQQQVALNEWLDICRASYNYALRELKDWISSRKCQIDRCSLESEYIMSADYPFPGYHQQQNNLPKAKKEFPRLTIEKHSTQGLWGKEIGYQVGLSGAFCLDKWRRVAMPSSNVGKPTL